MKHYFLLRMVLFVSVLCAGFVIALAQERQPAMHLQGQDDNYEKASVLEKPVSQEKKEQAVKEQLMLNEMSPADRAIFEEQQIVRIKAKMAQADPRELKTLYFSNRDEFMNLYGTIGEELFLGTPDSRKVVQSERSGIHQIDVEEFEKMPADRKAHIKANPQRYQISNQIK